MNQCKRLSDCPADRLAQCRGQAVRARCDALQGLLNKADQRIDDLTHPVPVPPAGYAPCSPSLLESGVDCATAPRWSSPTWDGHSHWHPVPPAGDVGCAICLSLGDQCLTCEESEFKAWAEKHFASPDYSQTSAGVYIKDWMRHSFAAWQARSKVVTRLTAECDGLAADADALKAQVKRLKDECIALGYVSDERDALQSELTKARELSPLVSGELYLLIRELSEEADNSSSYSSAEVIRQQVDCLRDAYAALTDLTAWKAEATNHLREVVDTGCELSKRNFNKLAEFLAHNVDESCGQDAEAAKGGSHE